MKRSSAKNLHPASFPQSRLLLPSDGYGLNEHGHKLRNNLPKSLLAMLCSAPCSYKGNVT